VLALALQRRDLAVQFFHVAAQLGLALQGRQGGLADAVRRGCDVRCRRRPRLAAAQGLEVAEAGLSTSGESGS
jgi:hypothetical protein